MMHLLLLPLVLLVPFALFSAEADLPEVVIFLGPPASGKGTQASRLAEELNLPHISTGDLFRENMSKNTELGQKAKNFINAGKLVPDELVLDMLFDRVAAPDCKNGYVLDGFPRTIPQAEELDTRLNGKVNLKVVNLVVADEILIKRTSGRRTSPTCKAVYNIYFNPPKVEGKCDIDGSDLVQREDDKPEIVKERLEVYKKQTEPLIEFYRKKGLLTDIQADNLPDEVYSQIKKAVSI